MYVIGGRGGKGGCTLFALLRKGDCPLCHAGKGDSPRFHTAGNGCSPLFLAGAVVVKKIGTTGTATVEELIAKLQPRS
jgi:hypothetical protein